MGSFAESTSVSVERSKAELDALLQKHGAMQRGSAHDDEGGFGVVYFRLADRQVRLQIPLPKMASFANRRNPRTKEIEPRTADDQRKLYEQACRTRWRAVLLVVKAKLELIEIGMSSVEREFLADITLPDGRSVGEWLKSGLESAYLNGSMPPMLGMGRARDGEEEA